VTPHLHLTSPRLGTLLFRCCMCLSSLTITIHHHHPSIHPPSTHPTKHHDMFGLQGYSSEEDEGSERSVKERRFRSRFKPLRCPY